MVIGGLGGYYYANKTLLDMYYFEYMYNPFKPNDNMYLKTWAVDKSSIKGSNNTLYRLVRPLNNDEVDNMSVSLADKIMIKKDLNSKKPYMMECGWVISTDSLCKRKSAFIGKYSNSKIANMYFGEDKYIPVIFFEIHPINKALVKVSYPAPPSGYTFDDNFPFYIDGSDVAMKDSKSFRD